ncbi:DNA polymerase [Rhodoblastus sp. 17X3]|uniref:DNA polymerase n=1 Tax=Rhodoblastus sp. 17X3 TaxID=3047026 RepID=UPI0024B71716|nr:DNA polymerase [Rhodoblastus sp. 17X3]MDI9848655.1 DNA polymerase [Rhodoblastus sp. 17X3]
MLGDLADIFTGLGYRRVWCVDFEFVAPSGHPPRPICMVAKCILTGETMRLWGDQLAHCPFDVADDVLFVAYYASAESSCFNVLGWPHPRRILDLFTEFRCLTNGVDTRHGNGLIGALLHYSLPTIGGEAKDDMRALIMGGGPWSDTEREQIIAYCESDVDALQRLLEAMSPAIVASPRRFGQALLRGRYMAAAGVVENHGVPLDVELLEQLTRNWATIKLGLIEAVDGDFGVYENGRFVQARFEGYLARNRIPWPRLASGALALDDETFRKQARAYPIIAPLCELRQALGQLRLNKLSVGPDGRNRILLSAFGARTGRNQPSTSRFIFGPSVWLRSLIRPARGQALAYVDWSSQEIAIAGALSGDEALWQAYDSGDPYIAFAKQAGLVPPDATKASHGDVRQACKSIVLGVNYGMGPESIAAQSGIHIDRARELLRLHRETYRGFWNWADEKVDRALLGLPLETVFGWRIQYPPGCNVAVNSRSILNWPMQSHGAEMMRLGLAMGIEAGLKVCAPIHDALLLEAPIDEIEDQAARLAEFMGDASELVLGPGKRCRSDIKIIRHPDRFDDERGTVMFKRVMSLLEAVEAGCDR